ncbi:MAG TPA: hypothetical protein VKE22_20405 [Haliangiales bacterium]|nr:hypothetical protein [Haliangiales bacterium]
MLARDIHEHPRLLYAISLAVIVGCVALLLAQGVDSCGSQRAARSGARVGCLERLADARACDQLIDAYHDRCYGLTYRPGTRFQRSTFDANGYLECVLASPERFEAARAAQQELRRREREAARRELGVP